MPRKIYFALIDKKKLIAEIEGKFIGLGGNWECFRFYWGFVNAIACLSSDQYKRYKGDGIT